MDSHDDLQELEKEAWPLKKKFLVIVEPYRTDLWRYCRSLTGSPWDAEDLVQETLIKAFASLGQIWQPLMPKSYLFRIATNTWINQCRRNKTIADDDMDSTLPASAEPTKFEVHEAIETLLNHLLPRQVVVVLLIDVFDFTAIEAADMIATTEGAVKATLHRARVKLKSLWGKGMEKTEVPIFTKESRHTVDPILIDAFVDAFNRRDPDAMAALLAENSHHDIVHIGQEYGRETIRKYSIADEFKDPTIEQQRAERITLWGIPVMMVVIECEGRWELNDIISFETEADHISSFRHYYFCQDLLAAAAMELAIPLQSNKLYKIE